MNYEVCRPLRGRDKAQNLRPQLPEIQSADTRSPFQTSFRYITDYTGLSSSVALNR